MSMSMSRFESRRAAPPPSPEREAGRVVGRIVGRVVGRVAALWRYPVKSMAGEALDGAELSWHGLAGDRRWAFVRDGRQSSGFPWLTMRERPAMAHYRPRFTQPEQPDRSPTVVRTPSGAELDVVDPALAAELGDGVHVIKQDRGVFDTLPLSLISTQAIAALGALVDAELDVRRFRPNVVIAASHAASDGATDQVPDQPTGGDAFPEDGWIGSVLCIGSARVRIDKRDQRCVVVNIDPTTTRSDPAILRAIADERASCLGVYGSAVQPGRVAVGDAVILEDRVAAARVARR